jgi:RHS repeat-associated protein
MKRCRSELNRFNSGKIHPEPRDLSPASAPSSAPARNQYTYYLHDGLGSVTALVDAAGNLDGCYDYGAFGDERKNTVMIENRYRYSSREHVEPNLYYYRARYMRPDLGRFVSMDPLKMIDGTNLFGYVQNNPIHFHDNSGKQLDKGCECYQEYVRLKQQVDWACRSVEMRIDAICPKVPGLQQCIKRKICSRYFGFIIYCRFNCPPLDIGQGPTKTRAFICVNNIEIKDLDDVILHEIAHTCGWRHHDGCGVPFQSGKYEP